MPSDIPIYTQSSNFGSLLEKGVDPRTGQYTCAIDVWGAPEEARNCPSLKLTLSFSPMNFFDFGLGKGWSFNLTNYDNESKTLYLSTGEHFKVIELAGSVSVPDQKLKSFNFTKFQKEENGRKVTSYQVVYKSGQVEILKNSSGIFDRFVPFQIVAPNGRHLRLIWEVLKSTGYPLLTKIEEDSQDLLEVDYKSIVKKIIRSPNTPEKSTLSLGVRDNYLKKLVLPLASAPSWTFDYELHGPSLCITKTTSPSGLQEQLEYKLDGHRLPPKAPYLYIPHVEWHTVWPGNFPPKIKTKYEFSPRDGHNSYGYNAGLEWNDGEDNLYRTRDEYTYSSIVTVQGGTKTTNTYNHFHLLVSSQQEKGSCVTTESISYHSKPYEKFEKQPAYCQLPHTTIKMYKDNSGRSPRSETTKQTYDEWGNPTLEIRPDGVEIHRTYYPEEGEDTSDSNNLGCPRDPHGFRRYMKTETVVPGPGDYPAPTRTEKYRYVKIPTAHGAEAAYFVGAQQHITSTGNHVLSRTTFAYLDNPTATYHGCLEQQVTSHLDKSPTTKKLSYSRNGDLMTLKACTTTFDGSVVEEETVYSALRGLTMAHKDQAGVEDCFLYNTLGQITKAITSAGTPQEAVRQWEYAALEQNYGTETIVTDATGVKTRYVTDGLERPCRTEKQDHDREAYAAGNTSAEFHLAEKRNYDAQGQCIEVTEVDWLRGENGQLTSLETSKQLEYDNWGGVCKTTEKSGLVTISKSDPVDLTETTGIEGEGYTKTYHDVSGNPTLIHLCKTDKTLYSSVKYRYDGLGRLVEEEDQVGRIIKYESDSFDRITKTTWSDSRTVTADYAEHGEAALPAKVSLNGVTIGGQSFDGLGRVMHRKVGPRTTRQIYEGHAPEPKRITNAKGQECEITYEPALQYAPKSLTTSDANSDIYEYDPQTALPTKMKGSYSTQIREYTPSSLLKKETIQVKGGESFSSEYQYSMAGLLQHYVNPHQQRQSIEYDTYGRPASLIQSKMRVSFIYCSRSGRLSEYSLEDQEDGVKLTFLLSYDDIGRETKRMVKKKGQVMYSLSQTYGETSLVATRALEDNEGVTIRDERLTYDNQNRLKRYECDGSRAPADQQGNEIKEQTFEFDEYDNIVKQTMTFHNQDSNAASYTFSKDDPTQLISITNTNNAYPASVVLEYDANGSLTRDEQGRKLEYDSLGRLIRVRAADDKQLCEYHYDASGKLACQSVPDQPDTSLFYREDSLIATKSGDRRVSYVSDGKAYWGQIIQDDGSDKPQNNLWASDSCGSILASLDSHRPEDMHSQSYTPYGFGGESDIAFNGQWKDPVTGWYHLGNGYRVYNPVLMRFHAADPWSPFTSGEINPYTYCLGDPVNRADPSGHFSLFGVNFGWKRLITAVIGIAASIAVGVLTGGASLAVQVALGAVVGAITAPVAGALGDLAEGRSPTWGSMGKDALVGFVGGAIGPALGKFARPYMDKYLGFLTKSGSYSVTKSVNNSIWRLGLQKHIAGYGMKDIVRTATKSTVVSFVTKQPLAIGL
ncbi:hypothetical protein P168DRAFT_330195 [Aspergillus campestris IBT 28561]|uniref:Teneurin-like YD-shell domain-containing protein n=1 Tax=Aspergillus campestris (strain IBT 28561) TaxID=1392248 RepID=A0A2I1CTE9_ASPC2|nr:uncharacterized protein P168DRAFT_330195 [Aspergillus campestris IBT 28561]PKY00898.1 hypothetical protein P168DRAFT_330195 [Aspergillus campestris IBT 28561]